MKMLIDTCAGAGKDCWEILTRFLPEEAAEVRSANAKCAEVKSASANSAGVKSAEVKSANAKSSGTKSADVKCLQIELKEMDGTPVRKKCFFLENGAGTCRMEIKGVRPWSPLKPYRYRVVVSQITGESAGRQGQISDVSGQISESCGQEGREEIISACIGFRNIKKSGSEIFWNGEKVRLKGICYREKPGTDIEVQRRDLIFFKKAGINYIRSIYGPFSQGMLELCDELGFWTEDTAPLYGIGDTMPATQNSPVHLEEQYMGPFRKMVEESFSHVSILLWSLGHDCVWGSNFRQMYRYIKSVDGQRLVNFHLPMTIPEEEPAMDVWSVHYIDWRQAMDEHFDQMVIFHTPGAHNEIGYATGRAEGCQMPVLHDIYAPIPCHNLEQIERDPGIREFWGESLKRFCTRMDACPGCLGGAVLAAVDEDGEALDGQGHPIGELTDLKWGILDAGHNPKPEYHHVRMAYQEKRPFVKRELPGYMEVSNGRFTYLFSRETCLLEKALADGAEVLTGGPYLQATRLKLEPWEGKGTEILIMADGNALAVLRGCYGRVCEVTFTLTLYPDGKIKTEYEIDKLAAFMPHTVKAGIGLDPGGLDERGVAYRTAAGMDELSWIRKGLWDWYPKEHIGAESGRADINMQEAFRSMKHHILNATLVRQADGARVQAVSDGSHSVRLEAWPDECMVVNDRDERISYQGQWQHMDDGCGNFRDTETLSRYKGDSYTFTFTGTGIAVYGPTDILYGKSRFFLDGELAGEEVSQYPKAAEFPVMSQGYEKRYRVCLFHISELEDGEHTLRAEVLGEKEKAAQDTYVSLDHMIVESPRYPLSQRLIINNDFNYTRLVQGNYMRDKVELKAGIKDGCMICIGRES